jgi:hypothetical protein
VIVTQQGVDEEDNLVPADSVPILQTQAQTIAVRDEREAEVGHHHRNAMDAPSSPAGTPLGGRLLSAASPFLHLVTEPRKRVLPDVVDDVIAHGSRVRLRVSRSCRDRPICSDVTADSRKQSFGENGS